jgi:hypothetical protein
MEELMNNIRNEVLSFQAFLRKEKNNTIERIKARILKLKEDAINNQVTIYELESELNIIVGNIGREELEKHHLFEILNNEKITPAFLKLSKSTSIEAMLTDIKSDDFESLSKQKEYIYEYFSGVYKMPADQRDD